MSVSLPRVRMSPNRDGWSGLAGRVGAGAVLLIALAISVAPGVYYPILAASLVLFSIPVLVLYFVFQQQFIEGLTAGALKH